MNAFAAIIARDLRLAVRVGGDTLTVILFFLGVGIVVPFAVGPDRPLLAQLAPAILWIAAFLSQLLAQDRLFRGDFEDGSLALMRFSATPLWASVLAKLIAYWLTTAAPILLATPLLALVTGMDGATLGRALLSLLLGTPALVGLGAVGAAVTVGLKRGGLVAPVLILPLCLPVLIFGVGAVAAGPMSSSDQAMLFLAALSLFTLAFAPFAAALALTISGE